MGAPRAGKIREGMVFIVETFSDTDSVSQVAQIKGQFLLENVFYPSKKVLISYYLCLTISIWNFCPFFDRKIAKEPKQNKSKSGIKFWYRKYR